MALLDLVHATEPAAPPNPAAAEDLIAQARPAWSVQDVDGWQLRHTPQLPWQVLNCIRPPLGPGRPGRPVTAGDVPTITAAADAFYHHKHPRQPRHYRVTHLPEHQELDRVLADNGYRATRTGLVMAAPVESMLHAIGDGDREVTVTITTEPAPEWLDYWARHDSPHIIQTVRLRLPTVYLLAHHHGQAVGVAMLSLHHGLALGSTLHVDPAARRLGIARALYRAGALHAGQHGITTVMIEVRPEKSAALALARKAGYTPRYTYHYRTSSP